MNWWPLLPVLQPNWMLQLGCGSIATTGGIESGLHQRLDVSHNDDRCRVRNHNAMWVLAMMRRLSNSLFMHWRQRKRRPDHVTTTDFQAHLSEDRLRQAMRLVQSCSGPKFACQSNIGFNVPEIRRLYKHIARTRKDADNPAIVSHSTFVKV